MSQSETISPDTYQTPPRDGNITKILGATILSKVDPNQPVEGQEEEHGNMTATQLDLKEILKPTTGPPQFPPKKLRSPQLQVAQAMARTQCSNIIPS